jgi:FKBP-type peptidyl-prolyl cis-trans isomerase FklB
MRYIAALACVLILSVVVSAQTKKEKVTLKTEDEKVSYSIGFSFGKNLKMNQITVDYDKLFAGVKDAFLDDASAALSDSEMTAVLTNFQNQLMKKKQEQMKAESGKNEAAGQAFLKENSKKEGVVTLPSGLQYKILKSGTGKTPTDTNTVTTHYKGTLLDGTVFDDSYSRGEPASFPVNGVIKGWTEALKLMKEGDKWQLFIPANLAYGERGAGNGAIPPGAVLIFEVELLKVEDTPASQQ